NDTISDSSGSDTLDFSSMATTGSNGVTVDLTALNTSTFTPISTPSASVGIRLGAADILENITGTSGNDTLTGNSLDNTLNGGAGNDTYRFVGYGHLGTDALVESTGNDTLDFSNLQFGTNIGVDLTPSTLTTYKFYSGLNNANSLLITLIPNQFENLVG